MEVEVRLEDGWGGLDIREDGDGGEEVGECLFDGGEEGGWWRGE